LFYGVLFLLLTFAISKTDSIVQLVMVFIGVIEGPITAIFLIGVLTRKASDKVAMLGLTFGFVVTSWISFGKLFSGYHYPSLPLETSGCNFSNTSLVLLENKNSSCLELESCSTDFEKPVIGDTFFLYKITSFWIGPLACLFTISATFIILLLTGWKNNVIPADSKCLSPVTRYWFKQVEQDDSEHISSKNQEATHYVDLTEEEIKF
ncbi:sodium-coupled monocarboxylate transporter 1, partial [Trichonephila clavata]